MLLSKIFTGLALLSASATTLASPTPVDFAKIEKTSLTRRALVEVPVCASVDLSSVQLEAQLGTLGLSILDLTAVSAVLSLFRLGSFCLCLEAGVLDAESILTVTEGITAGTGTLGAVSDIISGIVFPLVTALEPTLRLLLINRQDTIQKQCTIPTNAVQNRECVIECPTFTCPTTLPQNCPVRNECIAADADCCLDDQKDCGDGVCVPNATLCPSGGTTRKRSARERSRYACRQPLTACPVSHFLARDGSSVAGAGFECLDTLANIESCGGCISPFKGNVAGQDCTAIANADDVACTAGTCIVGSCVAGFVPSADGSACVTSSSGARFSIQGLK